MENLYMYVAYATGGFAVALADRVTHILLLSSQYVAGGWSLWKKTPDGEKWQTTDITDMVANLPDIDSGWVRIMACEEGAKPDEAYASYLLNIEMIEWAEHLTIRLGGGE